jgi:nicotinamide-nucleotide amidase
VDETTHVVDRIARVARERRWRVGAAESLTSGLLLHRLGAGPDASGWFAGGVVAYALDVKFEVLGVTPGPVVTSKCAEEMVAGVARLLRADAAVAVSGGGGPGSEGFSPRVRRFVATWVEGNVSSHHHHFDGDPGIVVDRAADTALACLEQAMTWGDVGASPTDGTEQTGYEPA